MPWSSATSSELSGDPTAISVAGSSHSSVGAGVVAVAAEP